MRGARVLDGASVALRLIGVRRSPIINDVKPEWRRRYELAFPDRLAGA